MSHLTDRQVAKPAEVGIHNLQIIIPSAILLSSFPGLPFSVNELIVFLPELNASAVGTQYIRSAPCHFYSLSSIFLVQAIGHLLDTYCPGHRPHTLGGLSAAVVTSVAAVRSDGLVRICDLHLVALPYPVSHFNSLSISSFVKYR